MAFDSYVLSAVVSELQPLIGARINKIQQPDAYTVVLRYHNTEGRGSLLLSAHPQNGRIHLSSSSRENPAKAPLFVMVLRKWLDGGRLLRITATPGERVARLEIETHNEMGDTVVLSLIVEIMGKHSNIILVNDKGLIIDGIHRYGSSQSRYREVLPGRPYLAPPPQNKLSFPPSDIDSLAAILYEETAGDGSELHIHSLHKALITRINGLSPMLAEHVCLSAGIDPDRGVDLLGAGEIEALWQVMRELDNRQGAQKPVLRRSTDGSEYSDFYAFAPAQWPNGELTECASMNEAIDRLYTVREELQAVQTQRSRLAKQLRAHSNRLGKKIAIQESDLARSLAADSFKRAGDLLAANLWQLEQDRSHRGLSELELPSFEDPQRMEKVSLDPSLTIQENITRCYRRYSKAKHARSLIEQQLNSNREELDYIESIEQALQDSSRRDELLEIEREGIAAGYLHATAGEKGRSANSRKASGKDQHSGSLPPRRFTGCDGYTVLIGRNNRQNDKLSLHMAQRGDIWLHTQKIPGSHCIILGNGQPVPETTLLQAAAWAAWFSKARGSAQVPVDWLPAERLHKPAGARPGFVVYTGQKTVFVTPQEPDKDASSD